MSTNPLHIPEFPTETDYPEQFVEQYELLELLSENDCAETLLVRDRMSGALCVAKCCETDSPLCERPEPEGLKNLSGSPFPAFVAEFRNDKKYCILREYVPGESLDRACGNRHFSDEEIIRIGEQLCDQLLLLHQLDPPVIHRDIKPENVILRPDGQAVLIDFGIAREYRPEDASDTFIMGTKGFAAPEQYGFSQTDARSDIYSLGMLLSWLCRFREHSNESGKTKENNALARIISKCCAFDPSRRYRNVSYLKRDLHKAEVIRTSTWYVRCFAALSVPLILTAVVLILTISPRNPSDTFLTESFTEPLVEQCVRLQLDLPDDAPIPKDRLTEIKGIYIVNDQVFKDENSFYEAVEELYSDGKIPHGSLDSLDDIRFLPSLTRVLIAAESLKAIDALSSLKNLEKLEIKHNLVEDISVLKGMDSLVYVGINDNPVTDISALAQCRNLAFLDLCDVRSYDASAVSMLGDFEYLDLSNPTDSSRFLGMRRIVRLRLAWTRLSSLDDLKDVTGLEELDISHTKVTDLSGLDVHADLKILNLAALSLTSLEVLEQLPSLDTVIVSREMAPLLQKLNEPHFSVVYED